MEFIAPTEIHNEFDELLEKAIDINATETERMDLFRWIENYVDDTWDNGYYKIEEDGKTIIVTPVLEEVGDGAYQPVDCEIEFE